MSLEQIGSTEWVILIAAVSILIGVGLGFALGRGSGGRKKVGELQAELEASQQELADYKRDVFGQFAETAEKFRALDKSYHDLHRQLATSSVALCGDAATPLLSAPNAQDLPSEIVVSEQAEADQNAASEPQPDMDAVAEAVPGDPVDVDDLGATRTSTSADGDAAAGVDAQQAEAGADEVALADAGDAQAEKDIPVLTEVTDAEVAAEAAEKDAKERQTA